MTDARPQGDEQRLSPATPNVDVEDPSIDRTMTLSPFDSLDIQPAEKKTIHPPQSVDDVEKHVQPAHAILQTAKHSNTLASLGHIMQNDDSRASQCGSSAGCSGAGGEEAAIAAMEREKLQAICAFLNSEEVIAQLGY